MSYPLSDYLTSQERLKPNGRSQTTSRPFIRSSDVRDLFGPAEKLIVDYPMAALATAFLSGVFVAWLVKRK